MARKVHVKKKKSYGAEPGRDRVTEILDVIFAYAQLDFNKKAKVKGDESYIDAVAAGINMLGEELKASTISLYEKEVLIKEIHHRVKNNLAIISSLINMQMSKVKDDYHCRLLEDCKNRLMAISHIHQQLYFTNDLSKLDFAAYIANIIYMIESTYSEQRVVITTDLQPVIINIEKAVPCSLIVNELVTNCFKHAFTKMKKGKKIHVSLKIKGNKTELSIKDNGKGISVSKTSKDSMGLSLVRDLAAQLDGSVKWVKKNGTEVLVSCPA